jgi:hypothetical protein
MLTPDEQKRLSQALFSLIIRHNVICDRDRAKLETTAFTVAKAISDGVGLEGALALLRSASPPDDEVQSRFSTLRFSRSESSVAQVLLRSMEYQSRRTEELVIATPEKVHLEHIYPQRPAADRCGNHDEYVGRIGNLTLLDRRLNQEAKNSPFLVKRDQFYQASEIYLTRELLDQRSWAQAEIDTRQTHLRDLALEIWPAALVR